MRTLPATVRAAQQYPYGGHRRTGEVRRRDSHRGAGVARQCEVAGGGCQPERAIEVLSREEILSAVVRHPSQRSRPSTPWRRTDRHCAGLSSSSSRCAPISCRKSACGGSIQRSSAHTSIGDLKRLGYCVDPGHELRPTVFSKRWWFEYWGFRVAAGAVGEGLAAIG